ncbi:MAG TPA: hypothetical protein VHL58_18980 [Thermoanaerobaculia bacterium]|nr:hypothetical protein [Thermoanaerobaculia bacterium]
MAGQEISPKVESGDRGIEQRPGTGVDRTLIHNMLMLTPAERVQVLVASARNLATLLATIDRMRERAISFSSRIGSWMMT